MSQRVRYIILIIVVVALLAGVYLYLTGGSSSSQQQGLVVQESSNIAAVGDQQILTLLQELKSISLDAELFSSPAFQSLQNFDTTLEQQPQGRSNPFAPIGVEIQPPPSEEAEQTPEQATSSEESGS